MEALKGRSFKKMFERPANKKNFLDNVTIDNSKLDTINEAAKPSATTESNITNIVEMRDKQIANNMEDVVKIDTIQGNEATVEKLKNELFVVSTKYANEQALVDGLKKQLEQQDLTLRNIRENQADSNNGDLLEKIALLESEKALLESNIKSDNIRFNQDLSVSQNELQSLNQKYESKCLEYTELRSQYELLEASKNEVEALLKISNTQEDEVLSCEVDEEIVHGEVTSTMAENGRLSALNHELELQLEKEIEARENAQMLYQELRSIMVSIGIEKNLEVFDQTKIELQQKTNIIAQQERLLNERDQYITSIQNSLVDGIGQMFLKRPTETVLVLDQHQEKEEGVLPEEPEEVIKKKAEDLNEANPDDPKQGELLTSLVNQLNEIITIKKTDEENAIRAQEEKYLQFLNENWIEIKQQAHALKTDGWSLEEISELLEVGIADLKKIINRRMPKGNRPT